MFSKKFEQFSRALLIKMGVQFTDGKIKISNDGGIEGYQQTMMISEQPELQFNVNDIIPRL